MRSDEDGLAEDEATPVAELPEHRAWIDACFAGHDAPTILERLRSRPEQRQPRVDALPCGRFDWHVGRLGAVQGGYAGMGSGRGSQRAISSSTTRS